MRIGRKGVIGTVDNQNYAGFWIRAAAAVIDTVLLAMVVYLPIMLIYGSEHWQAEQLVSGFWDAVLYIAPIVITIWFWTKYLGTPGKLLLKLRVVDANTGNATSTPQALGRYLGYYVSTLPFLLGFIWVGIDKKKQGFHDKLAGTVVVRDTAAGKSG